MRLEKFPSLRGAEQREAGWTISRVLHPVLLLLVAVHPSKRGI